MQPNESEGEYLNIEAGLNPFFGEVQYRTTVSGTTQVKAIINPDLNLGFQLACAGLAIDGSKSMMPNFAAHLPPMLRKNKNTMQPILKSIAEFLAANAHGLVAATYWACGDDGGSIEPIGALSISDLAEHYFGGPTHWGGGTKLTPVIKFFWEEVFSQSTDSGLALVITDGAWTEDEQAELLEYSAYICSQIASGQRAPIKFVILAFRITGDKSEAELIQSRFASLDDFEHPSGVDIWDQKWIDTISDLNEIFVEIVKGRSLGLRARIIAGETEIVTFDDLCFEIRFDLPPGIDAFTLEIQELGSFTQILQ